MAYQELLTIAFSDLHLHDWNKYNDDMNRTKDTLKAFFKVLYLANEMRVPVTFCGDFFHKQSGISNELMEIITGNLGGLLAGFNVKVFGITGNHDQSKLNTLEKPSPSLWTSLCNMFPENLYCLDNTYMKENGIVMCGIPYLTFNQGFEDQVETFRDLKTDWPKILLIHTNLHGSRETDGRLMPEPNNIPVEMDEFFKGFDWILCGHIHKPQKLGKRIINIGAPNQQRTSDMASEFGCWFIYEKKAVFHPFTDLPVFKYFNKKDGHPPTLDYWVPEGVTQEETEEVNEEVEFNSTDNRVTLANKYCDAKGIKNRLKRSTLRDLLND